MSPLLPSLPAVSVDCDHTWADGWGEHTCHLRHLPDERHDGPHRCWCDATREQTPITTKETQS